MLIPFKEALPSWLNHPPKAPPTNIILFPLVVGISTYEFWGHSDHSMHLHKVMIRVPRRWNWMRWMPQLNCVVYSFTGWWYGDGFKPDDNDCIWFLLVSLFSDQIQNIKKRSDFSFSGQWDVVVESDEKQETLVFGGILVCSGYYLSTYHFSPSQVCHKNQLSGKVLAK